MKKVLSMLSATRYVLGSFVTDAHGRILARYGLSQYKDSDVTAFVPYCLLCISAMRKLDIQDSIYQLACSEGIMLFSDLGEALIVVLAYINLNLTQFTRSFNLATKELKEHFAQVRHKGDLIKNQLLTVDTGVNEVSGAILKRMESSASCSDPPTQRMILE